MKKIKDKLSYLLKVFMAVGLLFSNLTSLSIVFADELENNDVQVGGGVANGGGEENNNENANDENVNNNENNNGDQTPSTGGNDDPTVGTGGGSEPTVPENVFTVDLNDQYQIVVKYTGEYPEGSSLVVSENITYIDNNNSGDTNYTIELTDDVKAALSDDGYTIESQIFATNQYPGMYRATATIGDINAQFSKNIVYSDADFGYDLVEFNDSPYGSVIAANESGKYVVDKSAASLVLVALIGQGKTCPSMSFTYNGISYTAEEIANGIELSSMSLEGHLHGEFTISLNGTLTDCSGNVVEYNENRQVVYGEYQDNTDKLNESAKNVGLDSDYVFSGNTANGTLLILTDDDSTLEDILKDMIGEGEIVSYTIEDGTMTLTDSYGITVTYSTPTSSGDTTIDSKLVTPEGDVNSGNEFTISYVTTLKDYAINGVSGLINYDEDLLELISVESSQFDKGSHKDGKFAFVGSNKLMGTPEAGFGEKVNYSETDYIIVKMTFKAKAAGEASVSVTDNKFYNDGIYYVPTGEVSAVVVINASSDNALATLTVAGQEISLEDGTLDYEITVANDITDPAVVATLVNDSAEITSIAYPEELAEGENTVTITVTAANGDERVYTIKVIREAAVKEETTNPQPMVYQTNDNSTSDVPMITSVPTGDDAVPTNGDDDSKDGNDVSKIVVTILILLVIAGLIYLIFKDDKDDAETRKANRDINKFKKEDSEITDRPKRDDYRPRNGNNHGNNNKGKNSKNNNKKGR